MAKEWFESWFDSKYYHTLYKSRDHSEAEEFIDNLLTFLSPTPNSQFIDIACGKGRHSQFINQKGFKVVGFDLSEQSILEARKKTIVLNISFCANTNRISTRDILQIN